MTGVWASAARQAHTLHAAAALIERAGIAGVSVAVNSASIDIMVPVECGSLAMRKAAVEKLAAAAGTRAVRRDYPDGPLLGVIRAEGSHDGHPVSIFTVIPDVSS
jgi:hypothetical protein